ncbi:MAG: hypothetical protein ACOX2F_05505 [bacterium]
MKQKLDETGFEKLNDFQIMQKIVNGTFSRNRSYEFFKTKRGMALFKKAKIVSGFLDDLKNGAKMVSEKDEEEGKFITLENSNEKYKRTVFMDKNMYSVFSLEKRVLNNLD